MSKFTDELDQTNKTTSPSSRPETDLLKREQDRIEIEMEKERLRAEAENLKRERELMLAANAHKHRSNQHLPSNWLLIGDETGANPSNAHMIDQKLRRSVPNLLNNGLGIEPPPIQQQQQQQLPSRPAFIAAPSSNMQTTRLRYSSQLTTGTNPATISTSSARNLSSKPPQPYYTGYSSNRSGSQNELKLYSHQPVPPQPSSHRTTSSSSSSSSSSMPIPPPPPPNNPIPTISLNQKCSNCTQTLGQGSAMYIEKLGLAFHLKCFRCSVCHQPLGNGLEGTDVRVSSQNRLHCNSCFSNDLGKTKPSNTTTTTTSAHRSSSSSASSSSSTSYRGHYNQNNHHHHHHPSSYSTTTTNTTIMSTTSPKSVRHRRRLDYDDFVVLPNYYLAATMSQNSKPPSASISTRRQHH